MSVCHSQGPVTTSTCSMVIRMEALSDSIHGFHQPHNIEIIFKVYEINLHSSYEIQNQEMASYEKFITIKRGGH